MLVKQSLTLQQIENAQYISKNCPKSIMSIAITTMSPPDSLITLP